MSSTLAIGPWARLALLVILSTGFSLCPAMAARADEADDQYAVAAAHYAAGRWKLAIDEFQSLVDQFPEHSRRLPALFYLAEAQTQLGEYTAAAERFEQVLNEEPAGRFAKQALFRSGETRYLLGDAQGAAERLEQFLQDFPDDPLAAYVLPYLGELALQQQHDETARDYFQRGLRQFPDGRMQDDCRYGLARALQRTGDEDEAQQLLQALAGKRSSPLADDAQYQLAAGLYATARYEQALAAFVEFQTHHPESPLANQAGLGRGWALYQLGQHPAAAEVFQQLLADPQLGVEARYWLGLTQKAQQQWDAAATTLAALATAPADHPLTPAIAFHTAESWEKSGTADDARLQYERYLELEPQGELADDALAGLIRLAAGADDVERLDALASDFQTQYPESPLLVEVQREQARSLVKREQFAEAVDLLRALQQALASQSEPVDHYLLAVALEGLGRSDEAVAALQPLLETPLPDETSAEAKLLADARRLQATLLVALGDHAAALNALEAYLATDPAAPDRTHALAQMAITQAEVGQLNDALATLGTLTAATPGNDVLLPVVENLAERALAADRHDEAQRLFKRLASLDVPAEYIPRGLSGLAWSELRGGQPAAASETFALLIQQFPEHSLVSEAALARGHLLETAGNSDPALAMYRVVIDRFSDSEHYPEALLRAARLHDRLAQDQEAATLFERYLAEFPTADGRDQLHYELGWIYRELGRPDAADEQFEIVCNKFPDSPWQAEAAYVLAERAYQAEDLSRAAALLDEVLSPAPPEPLRAKGLFLRGQVAAATERWADVDTAMSELLRESPASPLAQLAEYWLAEAAYRQNRFQDAGERFAVLQRQTLASNEPWVATVSLRRAQVLAQQNRWAEAQQVAAELKHRFPDFVQMYEVDYLLGRALASQALFAEARDAYRNVTRSADGGKTETAAMAQWMIGETYFHQKNYDAAVREYLRLEILYAYPRWQAGALLQAGKCHEFLGEWQDAMELYARLLREYPETEFSAEASERLKQARSRISSA